MEKMEQCAKRTTCTTVIDKDINITHYYTSVPEEQNTFHGNDSPAEEVQVSQLVKLSSLPDSLDHLQFPYRQNRSTDEASITIILSELIIKLRDLGLNTNYVTAS